MKHPILVQKLFDYGKQYNNGSDFFELEGDSCMALTAKAAIEVCEEASERKRFVWIVEGGHWLNPGYRPDSSTRWDARTELEKSGEFQKNNDIAIENIKEDAAMGYSAFMITLSK